ncbi:hypothetical protein O3P69_018945 [Scylla paramamosain]|uniref:Uncharacterized protein n=1 Tax=Scylla paramamosain TaxID=85552 RepID=A0AAW0SC86_SCYPA
MPLSITSHHHLSPTINMYSKEGAGDSGPDRHHTGDYLAPLASVDLGNLTTHIVWSILVEVVVFVVTVVLVMVDSSDWPEVFLWIASVVILNVAIGIFQNTVYGTAAHLPFNYTVAVVLDSLHFSRDTLQSQDECSQLQHDIDKL